MGRPQFGLPRLRVWATGIAIGPDHTLFLPASWVKEKPSRVREGFGLEIPFLLADGGEAMLSVPPGFEAVHLLGFLFGRRRLRRAAHA